MKVSYKMKYNYELNYKQVHDIIYFLNRTLDNYVKRSKEKHRIYQHFSKYHIGDDEYFEEYANDIKRYNEYVSVLSDLIDIFEEELTNDN